MELTLKRLLEQAEFTQTRKGGYDQGEVDEFLDRAVAMATKVEAKLTETLAQPAAPASAGPSPADVEAEVERRVAARLADATPAAPAGPSEEQVAAEVSRTIVLAQRTADAVTGEAREEAARLVAEATERARQIDADAADRAAAARAELDASLAADRTAARERLAGEIGELESVREALRSDATVLERHVEEQRNQVRSTLGELQRLLDDPAGFRLAPAPALLDPGLPDLGPDPAAAAPEPPAEPEPVAATEPEPEPSRPEAPAQTAVVIEDDAEGTGGGAPSAFDEVDHAAPGLHEGLDSGPPTAPVSAVDLGMQAPTAAADPAPAESGPGEEDAFLAELRKAMADEEPLGPRDHAQQATTAMLDDDDRRGWRRGKRR